MDSDRAIRGFGGLAFVLSIPFYGFGGDSATGRRARHCFQFHFMDSTLVFYARDWVREWLAFNSILWIPPLLSCLLGGPRLGGRSFQFHFMDSRGGVFSLVVSLFAFNSILWIPVALVTIVSTVGQNLPFNSILWIPQRTLRELREA